jgi:hypothetical protein
MPLVKAVSLSLMNYLTDFNFFQFFVTFFNSVIPFGLFFWGGGLVLFMVINMKTDNMAYAGAILTFYMVGISSTGMITNIYSATAMRYVGILIGFICAYYIFKAVRD